MPNQPARPASPSLVMAIVSAGVVLANLDLFIVNVALPDIARDFGGTSLGDLSWVLNGYAIIYAALLVFCGRLAERHPRDTSFLVGVALFTAASVACAMAHGVVALVTCRLFQAAGAALLTPTSLGLILATVPPDRRAGAVRLWAAIGGFAAALGPPIGGLLLTFGWRWIFLVNLPIGLIALIVGRARLPRVPGHDAPRPPLIPAITITSGIAALTFAIIKLNDWGPRSPAIAASFAAALLLLTLFVIHCLRAENPFIDPKLFRIRDFTRAILTMGPFSTAFGGFLLSLVLWEESVWHWPALTIGLSIAPGPLMVPITSLLLASRLIPRFGGTAVVALGLTTFAAGVLALALLLGEQPNPLLAVLGAMATGVGVGLTLPTLMGIGSAALPPSSFSTGSAAINMIRQLGFAIGVAILVAIIGLPDQPPTARIAAFHLAWSAMAAITALGLAPLLLLRR